MYTIYPQPMVPMPDTAHVPKKLKPKKPKPKKPKPKKPTPTFRAALGNVIASAPCIGCAPDRAREGYAFVFGGGSTAHLGGMRAAIASIRLFDTERSIVIVALQGALDKPRMNATLARVQAAFAPVRVISQPRLSAHDLVKHNPRCGGVTRNLARHLDRLGGMGEEASMTRELNANMSRLIDEVNRHNASCRHPRDWKGRVWQLCTHHNQLRRKLTAASVIRVRDAADSLHHSLTTSVRAGARSLDLWRTA